MPKTKKEEELEQQKKNKAPDEKEKQGTEKVPEPDKVIKGATDTVVKDVPDKIMSGVETVVEKVLPTDKKETGLSDAEKKNIKKAIDEKKAADKSAAKEKKAADKKAAKEKKAADKKATKEQKAADKKAKKERNKKNSKLDTMSDTHLRKEIEEEEEKKRKAAQAHPTKPGVAANLADMLLSNFGIRLPSAEAWDKYKEGDWQPPKYDDSKLNKLKKEQERRDEAREEKSKNAPDSNKEIVDLLKGIKENQGKTVEKPANTMKHELPKKEAPKKDSEFGKTMDLKNTLGKDGPKHDFKADVQRHTTTDMDAIKEESPEEAKNVDLFDKLVEKLESIFGKITEIGRNNLEQIWDANQRTQQSGVKDREFFGNELAQDSINRLAESKGNKADREAFNDLNTDPNFAKYTLKVSARSQEATSKASKAEEMRDDLSPKDLFESAEKSQKENKEIKNPKGEEVEKAPIEASEETKKSSTKQAETGAPGKVLEDILQKLTELLGIELSDNMRNNVQKLYEGDQRARDDMQKKSENRQPNETFSIGKKNAGDMIAFHQFEQRLEKGDKTLGNALEHPKFAETSQEIAANSKTGKFMGENEHTVASFEDNFKKKKGLTQMSDRVNLEIDEKMEKSFNIKPITTGKDPNLPKDSKQYGKNVFRMSGDIYFNAIPGKEEVAKEDVKKLNNRAKSINHLGEDLAPEKQKQKEQKKEQQKEQQAQQQNIMQF